MDLSFINEFIAPLTLVICLAIGYILKNCVSNETINNFIPLIAGVLGVVIYTWDAAAFTPEVLATGLVTGLASTGLYEAFTQIIKLGNKDDEVSVG